MLAEALVWLRASCPPEARRFGHLREAIALQARARRCRHAWTAHLDHCHEAVHRSLADCPGGGTALVLGSGLALEYPLAILAAHFDRVVLADIVHLPAVRARARRHGNVALLECDLTGSLTALERLDRRAAADELDALGEPPRLTDETDPIAWVLSCNVLSQLPLLPVAWLRRRLAHPDEVGLEAFGRRLMARHLDWVATLAPRNCLIADAEQTTHDAAGRVVEHTDIARAFALDAKAYMEWEWRLAPPGELGGGLTATHRVVACRL